MKISTKIINCPLKDGEAYPIEYRNFNVGMAAVKGEELMMTIDTIDTGNPERQAALAALTDKINKKKASVTVTGRVDYDVINSQSFLESTADRIIINDFPDYIPENKKSDPH